MTDPLKDHRLEDILAYHQGFLDDAQRRELETHLHTCAACQKTSERALRFLPAVREAFTIPHFSSEELLANAQAELRERQAMSRPALWIFPCASLSSRLSRWAPSVLTSALIPRTSPQHHIVASPQRPADSQDAGAQLDAGIAP